MTMETRCCQKEFDLQTYTRHEISVPFAMSTNLQKKIPNFPKKKRIKQCQGRSWAKISLRKTQPNVSFEAATFRVLDRHRWTKPTTAS